MTEITVRAADSSLAMEEIQKKLGDNAFIISTRKTGGQIEIVATDDDAALSKKDKPFLLAGDYKINSFSSILDGKISASSEEPADNASNEMGANKQIDHLISQLLQLKRVNSETQKIALKDDSYKKLRLMGFSKQVVESLQQTAVSDEIEELIKKISKTFVSGKNKHFDESDVFIVVGQKNSGKSVFAEKFCSMMQDKNENCSISQIDDKNSKKLFKVAKDSLNTDANGLIIEKTYGNLDLDFLFLELKKIKSDVKISLVNTVAVGSSYEFLMKSIDPDLHQNQFVAFTKLDLCDISVPEISAILELDLKCLFFSGIDQVDDGLYFAKISQIEAFLTKKIIEKAS
tara:strand:+ start:7009 stop:8043 length:1035 start_codon:yes stop_codon:yes gene_type:complete